MKWNSMLLLEFAVDQTLLGSFSTESFNKQFIASKRQFMGKNKTEQFSSSIDLDIVKYCRNVEMFSQFLSEDF